MLFRSLKDRCILLGASECYTQYIEGDKCLAAPFWYNAIKLGPQMHKNYMMVICNLVDSYLEELASFGFYDATTDVMFKNDCRYIVYCFYYYKENFFKKLK